jgi:hypothetical protein
MGFIPNSKWNEFKSILDTSFSDFGEKVITLFKASQAIDTTHEDKLPQLISPGTELNALLNYNYMRTWPITVAKESGELDRQSLQAYFNKNYLKSKNLLTPDGNLDYRPDLDRFFIDGQFYKASGDTAVSQAKDKDIFFTVILKREEHNSHEFVIR